PPQWGSSGRAAELQAPRVALRAVAEALDLLVAVGPLASKDEVLEVLRAELANWKAHPRNAMATLTGLARKRLPFIASHVLNLMMESWVRTDVFHYNAAISAFEKGGQWQLAVSLLESMLGMRVIADTISN
ncbi:unnamed protein product, partial [Polarella glacialis]